MPDWRHDIASRLHGLSLSPARQGEIVDELAQHLDDRYDEKRRSGASDADARRMALDELDEERVLAIGMQTLKQASLPPAIAPGGPSRGRLLGDLVDDLRYGTRVLRRSPGFAFVATLVLALGIGLTAAVFGLVNAIFFRTLPVADPSALVWLHNPNDSIDLEAVAARADGVFTAYSRWSSASAGRILSAGNRHERLAGEVVGADYFSTLGVTPALGRALQQADENNGAPVIVISDATWARMFNRDPNVIGTEVRLDDGTLTVVGVMPPTFTGLSDPWHPTGYWMTLTYLSGSVPSDLLARIRRFSSAAIARLKPGVSVAGARAALSAMPGASAARRGTLGPYRVRSVADVLDPRDPDADVRWLTSLTYAGMTLAAAVLLLAMTNVTGIVLARGLLRGPEVAVRQAMGAGAFRLGRQLLTECVLLACVGGAAGLLVAGGLVRLYRTLSPPAFALDVPLDRHVTVFTTVVCLCAGLIVGLLPVRQALKVDVLSALGGNSRTGPTRRTRRRLRHAIVVPQIAISIVLLVAASVHGRALLQAELSNLGYRTDDVVAIETRMRVPRGDIEWKNVGGQWLGVPTQPGPTQAELVERSLAFDRNLLRRVREVPGVTGAALSSWLAPKSPGVGWIYSTRSDGVARAITTWANGVVSNGYFQAMDIRLLKGRDFSQQDTSSSPTVAIISASVENALWPADDAVGKTIVALGSANGRRTDDPPRFQVIGVVSDVRPVLSEAMTPAVYRPVTQLGGDYIAVHPPMQLLASGQGDPASLLRNVRHAIDQDPSAEVTSERTMREVVAEVLYSRRAMTWVLGLAGVAGLLLAVAGVYAVVSYSVAQQMRDVGIRASLGAGRADIVRLFLGQGLTTLGLAAVAGLPLAFSALRITSRLVGGAQASYAASFIVVPCVMAIVVLLACYVPARRAAGVDPVVVLRGL